LAWTIDYTKTAQSQLRKLDRTASLRIVDYMDERIALSGNPREQGKSLVGTHAGLWRYRVGDYRLICDIQDGRLIVLVLEIGHRKDIYD
jgi:mRNA interferase RelE/StbE